MMIDRFTYGAVILLAWLAGCLFGWVIGRYLLRVNDL